MSDFRREISLSSLFRDYNAQLITRSSFWKIHYEDLNYTVNLWPKFYPKIQVHGENWIECVKADKGRKLMNRRDWDGPVVIEDRNNDEDLSSSDDVTKAKQIRTYKLGFSNQGSFTCGEYRIP